MRGQYIFQWLRYLLDVSKLADEYPVRLGLIVAALHLDQQARGCDHFGKKDVTLAVIEGHDSATIRVLLKTELVASLFVAKSHLNLRQRHVLKFVDLHALVG